MSFSSSLPFPFRSHPSSSHKHHCNTIGAVPSSPLLPGPATVLFRPDHFMGPNASSSKLDGLLKMSTGQSCNLNQGRRFLCPKDRTNQENQDLCVCVRVEEINLLLVLQTQGVSFPSMRKGTRKRLVVHPSPGKFLPWKERITINSLDPSSNIPPRCFFDSPKVPSFQRLGKLIRIQYPKTRTKVVSDT